MARVQVPVTSGDVVPPIPEGPPWPEDFIAAVHAGCYEVDYRPLLEVDPDAANFLASLDTVTRILRTIGTRRTEL